MLGATVLQGSKGPPGCSCDLLAVIWCVSPLGCLEQPMPRAGETPWFDPSQNPAWKLSCLLLHIIPGNRPCFIFSSSGVLDSSGLRENNSPKPGQFPRSAKGPHQELAANTKMPNLEAWDFFTSPKSEARWYSMYLEGLNSHLPVFNYLTIQCFP